MTAIEHLVNTEVFKGLSDNQLNAIQVICSEVDFKNDDKIFNEGDPANHLWIVVEGQVDLRFELPNRPTTNKNTVATITAQGTESKTFGWSCFVPPYTYRLSAYCSSQSCKIIKIGKESLLKLFDNDVELGYQVMSFLVKTVGYRFQQFQDKIAKVMGDEILSDW